MVAGLRWDAYAPLRWAGLELAIHDASGDDADEILREAKPGDTPQAARTVPTSAMSVASDTTTLLPTSTTAPSTRTNDAPS